MLGTGSGHDGQSRTKWNVHRTFKPDRRKFHHGNEGPETRNRFLRQIGRYAAVACIILAVGSGAYYAGVKRPADDANTEVTMSVSNGQKADIILADGTKVYINSDSRIVYDNTYNKKTRMVSLEGEAYFEVAKDKEKPFIVKANGINVQALGTSFNIVHIKTINQ